MCYPTTTLLVHVRWCLERLKRVAIYQTYAHRKDQKSPKAQTGLLRQARPSADLPIAFVSADQRSS